MKPLKTLVLAACLVGTVTGLGHANDINTVAGTMNVPNNVTVVSGSNTNTLGVVKQIIEKEVAKPDTKKATVQNGKDALAALNQMGISYDVYQLQGSDKTGQKDALLVAVDMKAFADTFANDATKDPLIGQVLSVLNAGELDPITEQLMLGAVNMALPKESKTFTLPAKKTPTSAYMSNGKGHAAAVGMIGKDKKPSTITVENTELMEKLNNTKYQTYTVGARVLLNAEGYKLPYYAKAAIVMNPKKPTLYIALTSDVQRQYFMPIFDNAFKSIK